MARRYFRTARFRNWPNWTCWWSVQARPAVVPRSPRRNMDSEVGCAWDSSSGTVSPAACRPKRSTRFYGFYTPGDQPRKVVGELPDRVVNELARTGDMFLRSNTYGAGTGVTYNPERLKLVWDRLLDERRRASWFHTMLVDVHTNPEGIADRH